MLLYGWWVGRLLYKVITYKDRQGKDEIAEYIQELNNKMETNKAARVRYKKIIEYIGQLQTYGVAVGKPAIEKISNTELWEPRPIRERIFLLIGKTISLFFFIIL